MSAYNRAELSIEAYLVRILSALCKQSGGELRVSCALVDQVGDATTLMKWLDTEKQQLVLTTSMGSFTEVYRVTPERQTAAPVPIRPTDPLRNQPDMQPAPRAEDFTPSGTTLDDSRLSELERKRNVAHAAATIRNELRERQRQRERDQQQ